MFSNSFLQFVDELVLVYNETLIKVNRNYINHCGYNEESFKPNLFREVYLYKDVFLSTRLSGNYSERLELTTDQILFGYYIIKPQKPIEVYTNNNGTVYFPNFGYVQTGLKNKKIRIVWNENHKSFDIPEECRMRIKPLEAIILKELKIEVCQGVLPYTDKHFYGANYSEKTDFRIIASNHSKNLHLALEEIKLTVPYFHKWMNDVIQKIQIFNIPQILSFATYSLHGIDFISTNIKRSHIFYLEDLIHQSAHNIFYSVTFLNRKKLFNVDPHSKMNVFTRDKDERTIYGAFHGLFTQSNINIFFDACLESKKFNGEHEHELMGRLSDNMKRWKRTIHIFDSHDILSELGSKFFFEFKSIYEEISFRRKDLINFFHTENQPYVFDYDIFKSDNPVNFS